jgi:hypothetical protein
MKRMLNLLGATLLMAGIADAAFGQSGPAVDPQQLPAIQGKVEQYSLTPRGDGDGDGIASPLGKVIAAWRIGPSRSELAQVQSPPPGPRGPSRDRPEPPPPPR